MNLSPEGKVQYFVASVKKPTTVFELPSGLLEYCCEKDDYSFVTQWIKDMETEKNSTTKTVDGQKSEDLVSFKTMLCNNVAVVYNWDLSIILDTIEIAETQSEIDELTKVFKDGEKTRPLISTLADIYKCHQEMEAEIAELDKKNEARIAELDKKSKPDTLRMHVEPNYATKSVLELLCPQMKQRKQKADEKTKANINDNFEKAKAKKIDNFEKAKAKKIDNFAKKKKETTKPFRGQKTATSKDNIDLIKKIMNNILERWEHWTKDARAFKALSERLRLGPFGAFESTEGVMKVIDRRVTQPTLKYPYAISLEKKDLETLIAGKTLDKIDDLKAALSNHKDFFYIGDVLVSYANLEKNSFVYSSKHPHLGKVMHEMSDFSSPGSNLSDYLEALDGFLAPMLVMSDTEDEQLKYKFKVHKKSFHRIEVQDLNGSPIASLSKDQFVQVLPAMISNADGLLEHLERIQCLEKVNPDWGENRVTMRLHLPTNEWHASNPKYESVADFSAIGRPSVPGAELFDEDGRFVEPVFEEGVDLTQQELKDKNLCGLKGKKFVESNLLVCQPEDDDANQFEFSMHLNEIPPPKFNWDKLKVNLRTRFEQEATPHRVFLDFASGLYSINNTYAGTFSYLTNQEPGTDDLGEVQDLPSTPDEQKSKNNKPVKYAKLHGYPPDIIKVAGLVKKNISAGFKNFEMDFTNPNRRYIKLHGLHQMMFHNVPLEEDYIREFLSEVAAKCASEAMARWSPSAKGRNVFFELLGFNNRPSVSDIAGVQTDQDGAGKLASGAPLAKASRQPVILPDEGPEIAGGALDAPLAGAKENIFTRREGKAKRRWGAALLTATFIPLAVLAVKKADTLLRREKKSISHSNRKKQPSSDLKIKSGVDEAEKLPIAGNHNGDPRFTNHH
eukprot:GHVT01038652.1.p1 GENE.GHVT01038652.1~~GHVT01038652.1.p1  ORF type:complete len:901 (-),score=126.90 GHVT01038652.1:154-2856(-)